MVFNSRQNSHTTEVTSAAVRDELERVLKSGEFRAAGRTSEMLTFLVDQTLLGKSAELKEYVIGVEVFGKRVEYDPHSDSVVRVQAGRLRSRLTKYYATEGKSDPLVIDIPAGTYVPCFHRHGEEAGNTDFGRLWPVGALAPSRKKGFLGLLILIAVPLLGWLAFQYHLFAAISLLKPGRAPGAFTSPSAVAAFQDQRPADRPQAIAAYEAAVARYPSSARAWADLAHSYIAVDYLNPISSPELSRKAWEAAHRALSLDASLPESHAIAAWIDFYYGWNYRAAEEEFKQAAAASPECDVCLGWRALTLAAAGEQESALKYARQSVAAMPHSALRAVILATVLYYSGHADEAVDQASFAMKLSPDSGQAQAVMTASLVSLRQYDRLRGNGRFDSSIPPWLLGWYAHAEGMAGRKAEGRTMIASLEESVARGEAPIHAVAIGYAGLGDRDAALAALRRSLDLHDPKLVFLAVEPGYTALRGDPRFIEIQTTVLHR